MKNVLTPARSALIAALVVGAGMTADAQSQLRPALDAGERATRSASQTQARINQLDDERTDLIGEFRTLVQKKDSAQLQVRRLEQGTAGLLREIEAVEDQLGRVDEITAVMIPMMLDMIDDLEAFVQADLPFQKESRLANIAEIKAVMDRADVAPAEKYRIIIESYQRELDIGNKVNVWTQEIDINGKPTDVDMFQYGRLSLVYLTRDNRKAGLWNRDTRGWVDLDSSYNSQIRTAIKAANELIQPEIFAAPIARLAATAPPAATPAVLTDEAEEFRRVLSTTENLAIFHAQNEEILRSQENEIAILEESLETAEVRNLEVRPLLTQMVVDLKDFIAADLPYNLDERNARISALENSLDDEAVSVGELTSLILAAYKIELEEGEEQVLWDAQLDIDGSGELQEVRLYRYGRTAMVYVSADGNKAGRFDRQTRQWTPVNAATRREIVKAINIADGIAQRAVLFAPVTKFSAEN